jgi:hypothetical protein
MAEVNAIKHTFYDEDVRQDKAVSEATQSKLAESLAWIMQNSSDIIGQKIDVALTEAQFATLKGYSLIDGLGSPIPEASKKWVLLKGQSITGSDYANLTGVNTLPDMVTTEAHVAQALNDAALLSYQENQNKSHTHGIKVSNKAYTSGGTSVGNGIISISEGYSNSGQIANEGGAVARPNRVMLNTFIKINW